VLGLVRQRWLQIAVALSVIGCVFPDLDDDDPVLYALGDGLPHRDQRSSLGATHGIDSLRTDTLSKQEPLTLPPDLSNRWPAPDEESSPEQPELSPERPPPKSCA
jgi:hypothetical protein